MDKMRMDKLTFLGISLIIILSCIELYCLQKLRRELRRISQEKSDARREALRPRAYKKVRDSWTVYRNRRDLWEYLQKRGDKYADDK